MTLERKVQKAMRKGLVDVVERLLGEPPKHVYDYGMQPPWKKRAYQWLADQRRPVAVFPIHCWSAGYGGPQSPLTWFRCKTCGDARIGSPHAEPDYSCLHCQIAQRPFEGWEVADRSTAYRSTLTAAEGMSTHSLGGVLDGPQ